MSVLIDPPFDQTYVYGASPFVGLTTNVPSQAALHSGSVTTKFGEFKVGGDGEWFVEIFDTDPAVQFKDVEEVRVLVNLVKSRIVE